MQKEDLDFLPLDEVASSSVTKLGAEGNRCVYPDNTEALELDTNAGSNCSSSTDLKNSTPHESSPGPKQQTQTDRRESSAAPFGKDLDLSSWQLESTISNEPTQTQEKRCSPNLMSLGSENLSWELGDFGTVREDDSPDICEYYTTPTVGNTTGLTASQILIKPSR